MTKGAEGKVTQMGVSGTDVPRRKTENQMPCLWHNKGKHQVVSGTATSAKARAKEAPAARSNRARASHGDTGAAGLSRVRGGTRACLAAYSPPVIEAIVVFCTRDVSS